MAYIPVDMRVHMLLTWCERTRFLTTKGCESRWGTTQALVNGEKSSQWGESQGGLLGRGSQGHLQERGARRQAGKQAARV